MLSVAKKSIMQSVVMPIDFMLSVVAPKTKQPHPSQAKNFYPFERKENSWLVIEIIAYTLR